MSKRIESKASEVSAARRSSRACAEGVRSGAKGSVSKGDKEGEKVDAVASGVLETNGRRLPAGGSWRCYGHGRSMQGYGWRESGGCVKVLCSKALWRARAHWVQSTRRV